MPRVVIERQTPVVPTVRAMQARGMFDLAASQVSGERWEFDFDPPEPWHVGLIVGPSGSGKSTVARELFPGALVTGWPWPEDQSVLDGFPASMKIKDIVELLSSVGFSSPPAWLRPFRVLSNGEQFRVTMARTLAEMPDLAVVDEFTSVVDRQVAKVGASCVAKAVRRRGQRFVAVSCHHDIVDWLDPDWTFEPATGTLTRRLLRGRPSLQGSIRRDNYRAWEPFKRHHYLDHKINASATCFVLSIDGRDVAFSSFLQFPHPKVRDIRIAHRVVVLPDFQGLGIGGKFAEWTGEYLAARGFRYRFTTAHPALVAWFSRRPDRWRVPARSGRVGGRPGRKSADVALRRSVLDPRRMILRTFEYRPLARDRQ